MPIITVDVEHAGDRLDELIDAVIDGEEVIITWHDEAVAVLRLYDHAREAGLARINFAFPEEFDRPAGELLDYG
jgi:antitoxin (DNA-binding transcriptional repressor) of toxin-antitoxin stability system